jgi:hypothetical protein
MKTYLDLRVTESGDGLAVRTEYQSPAVMRAGILPFTASDGTVVAASPSGEPCVRTDGGRMTILLRTRACPLAKWNETKETKTADPRQAARKTRQAIRELREGLRARDSKKGNTK